MKSLAIAALLSTTILVVPHATSTEGETCTSTIGSSTKFVETWPDADTWHGSGALAAILPKNGHWPTTTPGHSIAVKLFWWRDGFAPGEESNLVVEIERLDNGPNGAKVLSPTNAKADSLGGWTMLTGIDFPSPGCWQVTGTYKSDQLKFIVETVESDRYRSDANK